MGSGGTRISQVGLGLVSRAGWVVPSAVLIDSTPMDPALLKPLTTSMAPITTESTYYAYGAQYEASRRSRDEGGHDPKRAKGGRGGDSMEQPRVDEAAANGDAGGWTEVA